VVQTHIHLHGNEAAQDSTTHPHQALQHAVGTALFFDELLQLSIAIVLTVLQKVVHQARQFRQELGIARRFGHQLVPQFFGTHLVEHPRFQERFGGAPQIQFGVELTAQAFDVEQGFLQQHELRLNLDIEAARGLE